MSKPTVPRATVVPLRPVIARGPGLSLAEVFPHGHPTKCITCNQEDPSPAGWRALFVQWVWEYHTPGVRKRARAALAMAPVDFAVRFRGFLSCDRCGGRICDACWSPLEREFVTHLEGLEAEGD